jgi:hypothetical protein
MALSNEESEVLDGASLQVPQGGASDFAKRRAIPLLALPCPDQEQTRGLEACGRVEQSELQHFAGQFAALGELARQACSGLIDFRYTALDGVSLFKYV